MTIKFINPHGVPFAEDAISEADVIAAPCVDTSIDSEACFVEFKDESDNHIAQPLVSTSSNSQG